MKIPEVTVEQMKEVDRLMTEEFGVSVPQMMELAGHVTARVVMDLFNPGEVLILAGKGNNGGDGLAAARHLHNFGVAVKVVLAGELRREMPRMQLKSLRKLGVPALDNPESIGNGKPNLVIDALLGYSAMGKPRGGTALLIMEARKLGVPVLSVDIPSGLEASTGMWFSPAFEDSTCLTLALPKYGMTSDPGIKRLLVGDIGIPREAFRRVGVEVPVLFREDSYREISMGCAKQTKPKSL